LRKAQHAFRPSHPPVQNDFLRRTFEHFVVEGKQIRPVPKFYMGLLWPPRALRGKSVYEACADPRAVGL